MIIHPVIPALIPNNFVVGDTRITGEYSGPIVRGRAYLDGEARAIGGEFERGRFTYFIGSGVNMDSILQIEGRNIDNEVITEKIQVTIIESEE